MSGYIFKSLKEVLLVRNITDGHTMPNDVAQAQTAWKQTLIVGSSLIMSAVIDRPIGVITIIDPGEQRQY